MAEPGGGDTEMNTAEDGEIQQSLNTGVQSAEQQAAKQAEEAQAAFMKMVLGSAASLPVSHMVVAPVTPFSGEDSGPSPNDFLSDFNAKAEASGLPKGKWVANALANMAVMPRQYCQKRLLAWKLEHPDQEVGWSDLEQVLRSGPWATKATVFALRCELDEVRLGVRQPVRVVTQKLESLFAKLAGLGAPVGHDEQLWALQRAVRARLPSGWPVGGQVHGPQWPGYEQLARCLLDKDAAEPERCVPKPVQDEAVFRKQGRRRGRPDQAGPSGGGQKHSGSKAAAPEGKRARFEYRGNNQLSPEERSKLMEAGKCFKCHQPGHRAYDTKSTPTGRKFVCPKRSSEVPKAK